MSAHTRGPSWFIEGDLIATSPSDPDSVEICFLAELGGPMTGSVRAANARLIAAAPELLEALRYAEAFIAIAVPSTARDREEAINEVLPAIRAAIDKATGAV